jgi:hypothetical protein
MKYPHKYPKLAKKKETHKILHRLNTRGGAASKQDKAQS